MNMKFSFNGTLDELKETISIKVKEYNKDIVVYDYDAGTLEIGFKRHGYNSGRFFVANIITTENEAVILDGETKDISPNTHKTKFGYIVSELTSTLLAYIILAIILMIPWALSRDIGILWKPQLFIIIYCVIYIFLDRMIEKSFPSIYKSKVCHFVIKFAPWLFTFYIILEIIPMIPWSLFKDYISLWISLLLPAIYLAIRSFLNKKNDYKCDKEFIDFMSMFTTYTESDSYSIQPSWDDVYKRLDLARGHIKSICDDDEDMLVITYDDGMLIDVGYVAEDKTYYITVVASDTAKGWKEPLGLVAVTDKSMLAPELQKAVYAFRNET